MTTLRFPVRLALAHIAREVPSGPRWSFEPKFDGWRACLFTSSNIVQSRTGNDLSRRFPEISAAAADLGDAVIDGELVALRQGRLDFAAMASPPAARARAAVTVYFVAFDLLAYGREDLRRRPYSDRRDQLSDLLVGVAPPLQQAPATTDRTAALSWISSAQAQVGIEGVVAKDRTASYPSGRSWAWRKTRYQEMTDCMVVGVTGALARPDALVLAQPDASGALRTVGVSLPLTNSVRAQLAGRLAAAGAPQHLPGLITGLPGRPGTDYQPTAPAVMAEIEVDASTEHGRYRHRPRVHRIHPEGQ